MHYFWQLRKPINPLLVESGPMTLMYFDPLSGRNRLKRRYVWGLYGLVCGLVLGMMLGFTVA